MFETLGIQKPDLASINSAAQALSIFHVLNTQSCSSHIQKVISFHVHPENLVELASRVKRLYFARSIKTKLYETIEHIDNKVTGDERLGDIIGIAESALLDLGDVLDIRQVEHIGSNVLEYIADKAKNPGLPPGLSSGFPTYDEAIGGGFRYGSTNYVGARPKGFKSAFALNVAKHITYDQKLPVLYLDTELDKYEEQIPRLLSILSGVSTTKIERGLFTKNDLEESRILEYGKQVSDKNQVPLYHVNIAQVKFTDHLSFAKRWIHSVVGVNNSGIANPCLIVYDYIKLVDPADMKNLQEFQAIGFLATSLQNFALRYKIPILVMCQLNRDGIDKESSSVFAQSDRIVWYCSNCSILKEKSADELGTNPIGTHKLVPTDVRHGRGVKFREYINLDINGDTFKISDKGLNTHQQGLTVDEHPANIEDAPN